MTFWEHLEELRRALIKIAIAAAACSTLAFIFKDEVFAAILAPGDGRFITYRLLEMAGASFQQTGTLDFKINLINTGLTAQFITHLKVALLTGLLVASPYAIYVLFSFIAPALRDNERRWTTRLVTASCLMFATGMATCYYIVFPLTLRFLGTYQVSTEVANLISLESYMSTLITTSLLMGTAFELPVLCWLLSKLNILTSNAMKRFRRHSFVAILILAAIITPTTDMFTMLVVALPVWLLYEMSISIVKRNEKTRGAQA